MSSQCYNPIQCPSIFPSNGDCGLYSHGLSIVGGTLAEGDPILSSILLQLGSDRRVGDEGGWWGEQFLGFELGTRLWSLAGKANSPEVRAEMDEAIREALEPLIDQGQIDEVYVRVADGLDGPDARVQVFKNGVALLEMAT